MKIVEFLDNNNRKLLKESNNNFNNLMCFFKSSKFKIEYGEGKIFIIVRKERVLFDDFLDKCLSPNLLIVHQRIVNYFNSHNIFLENLPLYLIRRHGSYSGSEGSKRRRRGWIVKFNNAWVVYVDNFISRHFFELSYFVKTNFEYEYSDLVNSFKFPFSSGGGEFEKINRFFPNLVHLSSNSNLYLSHLYDLNKGNYFINGKIIKASNILGNNKGKFGYGKIEDWNTPFEGKNIRTINEDLTVEELEFLKRYNIRMLSPINYFPFPKKGLIKNSEYNGESELIREYFKQYLVKRFHDKDLFKAIQ
ncbi:hypothetical protein CAPN010_21190 [Capnocytophaga cynodegmi]|uniref:hypothetical protein n=1 Tax=Capnocytophaga TaxID=1016 RepID=UPI001AD4AD8F|nr:MULTISPECIES: hypothetical protein [Capnocytophaga]GIM55780.1 hypothetical protein CAPN006_01740 [Capnocytophaga canimorsus]GJQ07961.1 hypothetical protein CAPN010_21190 [Capnocytophaga cynodegmi]